MTRPINPSFASFWRSVKDGLPKLIPVGDPPHEFVAQSERVLVCGWADQEFIVCTADLRRGGRGLQDRKVRWNAVEERFWGRDHLITHWMPLMPIRPAHKHRPKAGSAETSAGRIITPARAVEIHDSMFPRVTFLRDEVSANIAKYAEAIEAEVRASYLNSSIAKG